jgi:hypothetical protein
MSPKRLRIRRLRTTKPDWARATSVQDSICEPAIFLRPDPGGQANAESDLLAAVNQIIAGRQFVSAGLAFNNSPPSFWHPEGRTVVA